MARHHEVPDPDFHVMEALGYVEGLTMVACAAGEDQIDITGFQLMMLLRPLEERLERIELELKKESDFARRVGRLQG